MQVSLQPIQDDTPSGENLEYEKVFQDLELIARPKEAQQMGDEFVAGEAAADSDVSEKAREVLALSHDLRAAVILAGAELRMNGFAGFAAVTTYIRGCLQDYWPSCHPQLDDEDDNDPTMRVNAVLGLADRAVMISALRRAPMTVSKAFGPVSWRDIEVSTGEVVPTDEDKNLDSTAIGAAFQDSDKDDIKQILDSVTAASEDIKAIDAVFNDETPGQGPDLGPLMKTLQRIQERLSQEAGVDTDAEPDTTEDSATAVPSSQSAGGGAMNNNADVERAIDKIIAYYTANEPSSPVPLLLQRAKRMVGADFMEIMKDIAPDGVSNVKSVSGITDE